MRRLFFILLAVAIPATSGAQDPARPELPDDARVTLHEALEGSRSYKARIQAAILLGRRGSPRYDLIPLVDAMQGDEHHTVRGAAAMAIGNLGGVKGIEPLLGAVGDDEIFVRRAASHAIRKLASIQAIPYLKTARAREDPNVRMTAIEILGDIPQPEARRALTEFLGDTDPNVRETIERSISGWDREEIIEALSAAFNHPAYRVRGHAAKLATTYQDSRLVIPLAERLVSPLETQEVKDEVSRSLVALSGLVDVEDHVKRVLGLVDRDARVRSIVVLGFKGGPRAVEVLTRTTTDRDLKVRHYAVQALGRAGDKGAVPTLQNMKKLPENERIASTINAALRELDAL